MTKKKQKETKYTLEMLKAALADINAGMSYREAQKLYGISVATLNRHMKGKSKKIGWTILACCSADGNFIPISLMYKAKNIQSCWRANGPYNAVYNTSDSGWMEKKQFTHWFSQVFIPNANKVDPIGRKLLLLDGHASHISIDLIETARNNSVDLFRLPAHTSHIMQPCDLSLFGPFKSEWQKSVENFMKINKYQSILNKHFAGLINQAMTNSFKRSHAVSGFEKAGLWPVKRNQVLNNEQMKIGTVFSAKVAANETVTKRPVFGEITNNNIPTTPKTPKTPMSSQCYEEVLKTVCYNMIGNVQNAILNTLRNNGIQTPKTTKSSGISISNKCNYWMTSDEMTQKEKEKEEEKKQKELKQNANKAKRVERQLANKRKLEEKAAAGNSVKRKRGPKPKTDKEPANEPFQEAESIKETQPTKCYNCDSLFSQCFKANDWRTCENCPNWCCYLCINPDSDQLEYMCDNCK